MQQVVSLLSVGKTRKYWTWIRISNNLPHKIYCENIVNVVLLLYLFIGFKFLWFSSKGVQKFY